MLSIIKKGSVASLLLFSLTATCFAASLPTPQGMSASVQKQGSAKNIHALIEQLNAFLEIPYRIDGAINEQGEYTLFADESQRFATSGLNCSGFVLGVSRFLLQDNIAIEKAKKDRLGDSGPGAELGEDWDFGWDIIQNIAEGRSPQLLLPKGGTADPFQYNGLNVPSFDLHGKGVWDDVLSRIQPGMLYLLSYSKPSTLPGYKVLHYHVGIMIREDDHIWMYQTTTQSKKSYRRDMNNPKEKLDFLQAFANRGNIKKRISIIEVPLP